MTKLISKPYLYYLAVPLALLSVVAAAQNTDLDLRLPMSIDADSTAYDGKTSTIIFSGLRLSQGHIGIQADEGRAQRMELEDSSWRFSGNVVIDVENGHIESDSAVLQFDEFELKVATVIGSPATFQLTRSGNDEDTYAEAGKLLYDVEKGIIEFSDAATITEGGNKISSNFLVYNILEQRINADSSGSADDRVRITYTPTNGDEPSTDEPVEVESTNPPDPEEQDDNP